MNSTNEAIAPTLSGSELPITRRLRPLLAFFASFVGLGLGYVYVGKLRSAFVTVFATYGLILFGAWTRLIVTSAALLWTCSGVIAVVVLIALFHPTIIAWKTRTAPRPRYSRWWFYVIWLAVVGEGGLCIATYRATILGYETFRIPSEAMVPTLIPGDFFVSDSWRYRHTDPLNGEIVVFHPPGESHITYVKRVVGIAGDRLECRDSVLYRNGVAIVEPYLNVTGGGHFYGRNFGPLTVDSGKAYLLGDYRDNSQDSRTWGAIPTGNITGRAEFIWLSLGNGGIRWDRIGHSLRPAS